VGVLIFDTVIKMMKGVFAGIKTVILFLAAFLLSFLLSVSPAFIVIAAGLAGFLFFRRPPAAGTLSGAEDPPEKNGDGTGGRAP
jgi:chromate transport protein ChrA